MVKLCGGKGDHAITRIEGVIPKNNKTKQIHTKLYVFFPQANANVQFLEEDTGRHDSNSNTDSQNDM